MSDKYTIINALKTTGTSQFIKRLTPDQSLRSIPQVTEFISTHDNNDPARIKVLHSPRMISKGSHFAYNLPVKRVHYKPLLISEQAINDLQLKKDSDLVELLSGRKVYYDDKIFPYSIAYAGFQFGQFAGQLGDGRIVNLFDLKDKDGTYQTLQLKGSGQTPFSRFGDGKALLRSSIREFIISESLYNIGIPSTRAIQLTSLVGTNAQRSGLEPCAIVCRFAPSWIRIGNFDLFRWRPDTQGMVKLTDYCIDEVYHKGKDFPKDTDINWFNQDYFPTKTTTTSKSKEKSQALDNISIYDQFFRHVVNLNAECVAFWQAYGFVNGVLNTDNTSIMGLSMDFGPFSFIDKFNPNYTSNDDDVQGRYSLSNQPNIIWWNLIQLAQSIALLLGAGEKNLEKVKQMDLTTMSESFEKDLLERANIIIGLSENEYKYRFTRKYAEIMAKRLGIQLELPECHDMEIVKNTASEIKHFCDSIVEPLLQILQTTEIDYNQFFVNFQELSTNDINDVDGPNHLNIDYISIFFQPYQVDKIIKGDTRGDSGETRLLLETLQDIAKWTRSYLMIASNERQEVAKTANPLFIPRNWMFEEVVNDLTIKQRDQIGDISADLDLSLLKKLHLMSSNPYDSTKWQPELCPEAEQRWLAHQDPQNPHLNIQMSCSS